MASGGRGLAERLAAGVVLGDGGYILELEHRGYVQAGPFTPEVVDEHPDAVVQLHREFARAGAEVLQALTFYADDRGAGWTDRFMADVNRTAVALAREVAGPDRLVAGTLTQTVGFEPGVAASARRAAGVFASQLEAQCEAGVDLVIAETFRYLAEARVALAAILAAGVPAVVTLNLGPGGTYDGAGPAECIVALGGEGAVAVGVNCNWDPDVSLQVARAMVAAAPAGVAVACQPVGYRTADPAVPFVGLPEFPLGLEPLQLGREHLGRFAREAAEAGVGYIGGCCGVTAYHLRAMAESLGRSPEASAKSPDLTRHVIPAVRAAAAPAARSAGAPSDGAPSAGAPSAGAPSASTPGATEK